ncbi:MAG: hypothetical protein GY872_16710 [Roseibacillus sp.]|nr:hypothetical protein [Roseibacillus sp.]
MAHEDVRAELHHHHHTPTSIQSELISAGLGAGLDSKIATREVSRGWTRGQSDLALDAHRAITPLPTSSSSSPLPTSPPLTLEDVRAELHKRIDDIFPGSTHLLSLQTGVGKSKAKREHAAKTPPGILRILISKDRRAAIADSKVIDGSVLLLGKSSAGADLFDDDWTPHLTADGDLSTCNNGLALERSGRGGSSSDVCKSCPMQDACNGAQGIKGSRGQWEDVRKALKRGGVIVTTPLLLGPILGKWSRLDDQERAPIDQIWLDDIPSPPGSGVIEKRSLQLAAADLPRGPLRSALHDIADIIADHKKTDPGEHGTWLPAIETKELLSSISTKRLADGNVDGIPLPLVTLARWLAGDEDRASAYLVRTLTGAYLQVEPPPISPPPEAAIILASATAQAPLWEAWLGRKVEVWRPTIPIKARGLWIESGFWHPIRIARDPLNDLVEEAKRQGALLRDTYSDADKLLIVTHKAILDSPHWQAIKGALLDGAKLDSSKVKAIHWRGIQQVGSNAYTGWSILTLGPPRQNLGAWERTVATVNRWCPGKGADLSYDLEAQGWVEQAHGRARLLEHPDVAIAHIGANPSLSLQAICPHPLSLKPRRKGPAPKARTGASQWLDSLPISAISNALSSAPGAPARSTLQRLIKSRAEAMKQWRVKLSGRGGDQTWYGETMAEVEDGVFWLLQGRREVLSLDPVIDGHVIRPSKRIRSKTAIVGGEETTTGDDHPFPPPTGEASKTTTPPSSSPTSPPDLSPTSEPIQDVPASPPIDGQSGLNNSVLVHTLCEALLLAECFKNTWSAEPLDLETMIELLQAQDTGQAAPDLAPTSEPMAELEDGVSWLLQGEREVVELDPVIDGHVIRPSKRIRSKTAIVGGEEITTSSSLSTPPPTGVASKTPTSPSSSPSPPPDLTPTSEPIQSQQASQQARRSSISSSPGSSEDAKRNAPGAPRPMDELIPPPDDPLWLEWSDLDLKQTTIRIQRVEFPLIAWRGSRTELVQVLRDLYVGKLRRHDFISTTSPLSTAEAVKTMQWVIRRYSLSERLWPPGCDLDLDYLHEQVSMVTPPRRTKQPHRPQLL